MVAGWPFSENSRYEKFDNPKNLIIAPSNRLN